MYLTDIYGPVHIDEEISYIFQPIVQAQLSPCILSTVVIRELHCEVS